MIELAGLALGFFGKPLANGIASLFSKKKKPEEIAGTLAMGGNPETLPKYISAIAELRKADTEFFNRDVRGEIYKVINSLRATIRPVVVIGSMIGLTVMELDAPTKAILSAYIGDWCRGRQI